ncbi:hypothetical protein AAVH_17621 [Aphelenchoides avenae]|nr:hypothetical protein AAVH_17621 [Aphelenchus avenae]
MRETTLLHAERVNNSPRIEFDPTRKHDPSVGAETGIIPLASKPEWRTYWKPRNRHRIGMFLEETDVIATWVGYKHNQNPDVPLGTPAHHTMGVVTARIDRIEVASGAQFRDDQDVFMHGYVSWVGRSSLEVTVGVSQNDADHVPRQAPLSNQ